LEERDEAIVSRRRPKAVDEKFQKDERGQAMMLPKITRLGLDHVHPRAAHCQDAQRGAVRDAPSTARP